MVVTRDRRNVSKCTNPPESTGDTTRTNGGSKGKLSCADNQQRYFLNSLQRRQNSISLTFMQSHFYSLYMRSLVICNPFLPFPLRLVNHCVTGYPDPPCWPINSAVSPCLCWHGEKKGSNTRYSRPQFDVPLIQAIVKQLDWVDAWKGNAFHESLVTCPTAVNVSRWVN